MKEITIEVWGDFAAFNAPYAKVERLTYPFPTPSAARGILSAIYMKPKEFRWQINRIEVLNPIRYISFKRNEIKYTVSSEQISTEEERTQRHCRMSAIGSRRLSFHVRLLQEKRSSCMSRRCGASGTESVFTSQNLECANLSVILKRATGCVSLSSSRWMRG